MTASATASATPSYKPPVGFRPANVIVLRIGDGASALSASTSRVYLDEYDTNANAYSPAKYQSIQMPVITTLTNAALTVQGTDNKVTLSRTTDGQYLLVTGFDTGANTATSSLEGTGVKRVIGRVSWDAKINTTTKVPYGDGSSSIYSLYTACSKDGERYYPVGNQSLNQLIRVQHMTSSSTWVSISGSLDPEIRACTVFNDYIYLVGKAASTTNYRAGIAVPGSLVTSTDAWGLPLSPLSTIYWFGSTI